MKEKKLLGRLKSAVRSEANEEGEGGYLQNACLVSVGREGERE